MFARGLNRPLMPMQPVAVLGPGHPLARAAESRDVLGGHAIAVLAALLCGAAAALANETWACRW